MVLYKVVLKPDTRAHWLAAARVAALVCIPFNVCPVGCLLAGWVAI